MDQTDNLIQDAQMMNIFEGILDDLQEAHIPNPRIHTVTNFSKLDTFLIVYDRFCAVLEINEKKDIVYVALGRNDSNSLASGLLELIDVRVLDDEVIFAKGVIAFKAFIDNHEPNFVRDLPEITGRDEIIGTILDNWKLGNEIEQSGGFH